MVSELRRNITIRYSDSSNVCMVGTCQELALDWQFAGRSLREWAARFGSTRNREWDRRSVSPFLGTRLRTGANWVLNRRIDPRERRSPTTWASELCPLGGAAMDSAKTFETGKQLIGLAGSEISTLSAVSSAGSAVASVFPQHVRLINGVPEGMIATDDAGTIVYANQAEERTFGFAPGELIGM